MEARVKTLEDNVMQIRVDLADIKARIPYLSTKSNLEEVRSDTISIKTQIPFLATEAKLHDLKGSPIQWMVGTILASAALAATVAFGLAHLL